MNKKKLILVVTALICVLALSVGVTLAASFSDDSPKAETTNVVTIGRVDIDLIDIYTRPASVGPGQVVPKIVSVENTGENTAYVRIQVDKAWYESGTDNRLDTTVYDPGYIVLNFANPEDWVLGTDGYYYYQIPLEPGQTAENLIDSFSLPADWDMEGYQSLDGHITVRAEAVQYDNFYPTRNDEDDIVNWGGVEVQEALPEITYSFSNTTEDSNVIYQYGTDAFIVLPESKDLFGNFKGVMPGDTRTQTITVNNKNDKAVNIWLYALPADISDFEDVEGATAEHQKVLSDDLVQKLTVKIVDTKTGKVVYEGKLVGKGDQYNMQSPENAILLGLFNKGDTTNLEVTLSVPAELDNAYANSIAKIRWVFVADYNPDEPPPIIPTGDNLNTYLLIGGIVVISLVLVIVLVILGRKKKK